MVKSLGTVTLTVNGAELAASGLESMVTMQLDATGKRLLGESAALQPGEMPVRTLDDIRRQKPCYSPTKYLPERWQGTALDVLRVNDCPAADRLWVVLHPGWVDEDTLRLFAVWCARQALAGWRAWLTLAHGGDVDPVFAPINGALARAVDIAEAFARDQATREEMGVVCRAVGVWWFEDSHSRGAFLGALWHAAHACTWGYGWAAASAAARAAAEAAGELGARCGGSRRRRIREERSVQAQQLLTMLEGNARRSVGAQAE